MRYRVEMDHGVRIEASTAPGSPGIITLYFSAQGTIGAAVGGLKATDGTPPSPLSRRSLPANIRLSRRSMVFRRLWNLVGAQQSGRLATLASADQVGFLLGGGNRVQTTGGGRAQS